MGLIIIWRFNFTTDFNSQICKKKFFFKRRGWVFFIKLTLEKKKSSSCTNANYLIFLQHLNILPISLKRWSDQIFPRGSHIFHPSPPPIFRWFLQNFSSSSAASSLSKKKWEFLWVKGNKIITSTALLRHYRHRLLPFLRPSLLLHHLPTQATPFLQLQHHHLPPRKTPILYSPRLHAIT